MAEQKTSDVQSSYDRAADEYANHLYDELRHKPFDCQMLDRFAEAVRGKGLACDLGCGPGQIARYLHDRSVTVCGMDLSAGMIARARQLNPGIQFTQGDMLSLPVPDRAWAGIAAFYAVVNFPPADLEAVINEMYRVLQPEGSLLLAFHLGQQVVHEDDMWGKPVSLDFYFFRAEEVAGALRSAGLAIEEIIEREPYAPEVEYQSRRAYIMAKKPPDITKS